MITRLGLAPRRPGMTFAEFQHYWSNEHGPVAEAIPGLRGYLQNHAILEDGRPLLPYTGFDACSEIAFDDLEAMDAGFASPTYQSDVQADEVGFIDKPKFMMLLCDRRVIATGGSGEVKLLTFMRTHPLSTRDELVELAGGAYADAVRSAGSSRHEQLIPSPEAHAGRQAPNCDLVDLVWFESVERALDFVNGESGAAAESLLTGVAFGRERLLATVRVIRALPSEGDAP
jgi:uncharacterized protein (TIGR02118 family)